MRLDLYGKYDEVPVEEYNTLQVFITNRCNLRCRGCFYLDNLGNLDMSIKDYEKILDKYQHNIQKVVLLGGEPTLLDNIKDFVLINKDRELKTTIYSNGKNIDKLLGLDYSWLSVRVGVHGFDRSEKPLININKSEVPITIVYMLNNDNSNDLVQAAELAESEFGPSFYISSILEFGNNNTLNTMTQHEYFSTVQKFIVDYNGSLSLHIARRGIINSEFDTDTNTCRFGNVMHDGSLVQCPLDISINRKTNKLKFNSVNCNKSSQCIQRKIVLKRKQIM